MYFLILSILAGIPVYFRRNSPLHLKIFPIFLLITLIVELVAGYMVSHNKHTTTLYNIYTIMLFGFYVWFLTHIIESKRAKNIYKIVLWIYLVFALFNIIFFQKSGTYNSITYAIGCLTIVALSVYYFYELFERKQFLDLKREPSFWVATGLLFFFACSFPLVTTVNFIQNIPDIIINSLQSIILLINIMLYSLFTIAFLCRIKIPKYIL